MLEVTEPRAETATRSWTLLWGVLILTAISAGGAVIAVREGLSETWLDAVGPVGRLSIPLPMTALQLVSALAAGSPRRRVALTGSAVLALAALAAVVSGAFDGGYTDDRLTGAQRTYQLVLIGGIAVVGVLAAVRFVRVWRAR